MSLEQGQTPLLGSLDYLAEVAKDWAEAESPLSVAARINQPTAWCRADVTMRLVKTSTGMKTPHHQLDAEALGDHIDRLYRAARGLCSSRKRAPELLELASSIKQVEGLADKLPV